MLGATAILGLTALSACTRLDALNGLNAITPGDGDTLQLAADIPFGPHSRQMLDIYGPAKPASAALPVVVFFYGGSWNSGRRQDYGFAARALAARGFIVVVPDYRLAPAFAYPSFVEDGAAAVAWTAANIGKHGGDARRIGASGHSAGAYIAVLLALETAWLAKAGAPGAIKAGVGLAGPYDFLPFEPNGAADIAFGQWRDLKATQPITHVRADAPPLLLLAGDDDDVVFAHNGKNLAAALTARGAPVTLKSYPGIGHIGILLALSKPFRGNASALTDTADFFARHLG